MMTGEKIPVGILGATGSVGQKFVQLLDKHPWFEVAALAASERSQGKRYADAVGWFMSAPLPERIAALPVQACEPTLPCKIVFSGLDARVAGEIEETFANAGYLVVSNARNHRFDPDVPLLVPEINGGHIDMIKHQKYSGGAIVTNPNCSTVGLVMALKPLWDSFGVEAVHVTTLQAVSGAGYPGLPSLDIMDNVIPFIGGEEEKMESEPLKILGTHENGAVRNAQFQISAQCNRVGVSEGHLECVSVKLRKTASADEVKRVWQAFEGEPQALKLPFAPTRPLHYFDEDKSPQPKLHRDLENGMAVSIGRLRPCKLLDYRFVVLVHNTVRGAAGGAILNAELAVKKGLV